MGAGEVPPYAALEPRARIAGVSSRPVEPVTSTRARVVWIGLGSACVAVGAVGVVVPGLPTTPFLILAASCYVRSSRERHERLLAHPTFGPLVREFQQTRRVPRGAKLLALTLMAVFVTFALVVAIPADMVLAKVAVALAAVIGAVYLLSLPTTPPRA